jgi:3-methyladenine DNA glycosylase AlkD
MKTEIIQSLRAQINQLRSAEMVAKSQRFFKHSILCHGLKSKDSELIAREKFSKISHLSKAEIFDICETLWQSGYLEETFIACNWSYRMRKQYSREDFTLFERWINTYIDNWASCDTFCNHNVGDLLMMYPEFLPELFRWAKSENVWMRRAAAVSLIVPARKGLFLEEILQIADILLTDPEDMVQKGYGWMLKVAADKHRQVIFDYVMEHKKEMPRTALRYAIEKMPRELKEEAMKKDW